jgi:hypothetical protein
MQFTILLRIVKSVNGLILSFMLLSNNLIVALSNNLTTRQIFISAYTGQ